MTISTFGALVATIIADAATWIQEYRSASQNARIIKYLEGMPPYLRSDIGLPGDADLRSVVHGNRATAADDRQVQSHVGMMCHPV